MSTQLSQNLPHDVFVKQARRLPAELRRMFKEYDMNDDGNLNSEELEQCLQLVGFYPTADDIEFLKKHFDTNGDSP